MPAMSAFDKVVGDAVRDVPADGHERATHDWIVREVARLMRLPCAGIPARATRQAGAFHVPDDTLTTEQAALLGIADAGYLLGGVVPHAFMATKVISHPLVGEDAARPSGWNPLAAQALARATLPGYAVFSEADARRAHARLREGGLVRFKLATGVGGRGQWLLGDAATLECVLAELPRGYLAEHGAVLEQNVGDAITYSVGELHCAGIDIAYHGTQSAVKDQAGRDVYGGSDLWIIRGTLGDLAESGLNAEQKSAVERARLYDGFIADAYPGMQVSRRNYDILVSRDGTHAFCGVLEQSWRIGGATPAELAAVALFQRDPGLHRAYACTREIYDEAGPLPAGADVYYRSAAPANGPRLKYRLSSPLPDGSQAVQHPDPG
ncbi:DUF3182 family protein [[Pseudomonas] boreopolis]|uniref:Biotin carboxylase n=1 Tax=Xanthomonas boreopolis TaxID=86183 RepID=A0A919F4P9_9XANT|nr:hypothetical protein GCM10009090_02120 [[Pseudomonas] boreopolis]